MYVSLYIFYAVSHGHFTLIATKGLPGRLIKEESPYTKPGLYCQINSVLIVPELFNLVKIEISTARQVDFNKYLSKVWKK